MTTVAYAIAMPASRGILAPVPYCQEAVAFFQRLATQPSAARKALYNALIGALVAAGVWTKLDALYLLAAADQATALTNLARASYGATAVNSPAFTADLGFTGGSPKFINTNFNPSTAGGNWAQNSASAFAWSNKTAQDAGAIFGMVTATGGRSVEIFPRFLDNNAYTALNVNNIDQATASLDGSGLWLLTRVAAAGYDVYRNGALLASKTATSNVLQNSNLAILLHTGAAANYFGGTALCAGFGSGLSPAEQLALYDALHAYLQAVAGIA